MPVSDYRKKFTGMKKTPDEIKRINYEAFLTEKRIQRHKEMKKVRPHETMKAWENRIRKYNLMTEKQIQRIINQKKFVIKTRKRSRETIAKNKKTFNEVIWVEFFEKQFDFLSYYGIVLNFFSIKYGVRKMDLEICMAFYNNKIIDPNSFSNICILNAGNSSNFLSRFIKNGYISEILNHTKKATSEDVKSTKTNMYKLSIGMSFMISEIYKIIAKLNTLKEHRYKGMFPKELEQEFVKMNAEINDYLIGDKKQLNINKKTP